MSSLRRVELTVCVEEGHSGEGDKWKYIYCVISKCQGNPQSINCKGEAVHNFTTLAPNPSTSAKTTYITDTPSTIPLETTTYRTTTSDIDTTTTEYKSSEQPPTTSSTITTTKVIVTNKSYTKTVLIVCLSLLAVAVAFAVVFGVRRLGNGGRGSTSSTTDLKTNLTPGDTMATEYDSFDTYKIPTGRKMGGDTRHWKQSHEPQETEHDDHFQSIYEQISRQDHITNA